MSKSRASKMNGYRSMVSRQKNDVFKFKQKRKNKSKGVRGLLASVKELFTSKTNGISKRKDEAAGSL